MGITGLDKDSIPQVVGGIYPVPGTVATGESNRPGS